MSAEDLYELVRRKDQEISQLRELIDDLRSHIASAAADEAHDAVWTKTFEDLGELYYKHGFRSDLRLLG